MPQDIPKAVMVLLWLLVGVIIFGWLLMSFSVLYSLVFAIIYFSVPVLIYNKSVKDKL